MRRVVWAAVVCGLAVVCLAACGSSSSSSSSTATSSAASASSASSTTSGSVAGKSVTVVVGVKGFQYYTSLGCGALAEGKQLGLNVSVQGPNMFSPTAQIPVVNAVTAQRPDGAIVAPTDTKALVPPLQQMTAAGIKLVEVDTATIPPLGVTQITSDNAQAGTLGATTLAQVMGGKGTVLIVSTAPGVSTEDLRIQAFNKAIRSYPGIHVISTQYDGANPEKSVSVVSGVLSANPSLGGIFTTNLLSTEGVETALKQAHKSGSTKFVGSDGAAQQLADLEANVMQGIILQKPFVEGQLAVQQAYNALAGKPVSPPQQVGVVALTKSNLDTNKKYIYQDHC
jgi:ribose transport system substrate-binding protein